MLKTPKLIQTPVSPNIFGRVFNDTKAAHVATTVESESCMKLPHLHRKAKERLGSLVSNFNHINKMRFEKDDDIDSPYHHTFSDENKPVDYLIHAGENTWNNGGLPNLL